MDNGPGGGPVSGVVPSYDELDVRLAWRPIPPLELSVVGQNLFSTHGRGIFLINQLMDEVHFEKGGTEIHMKIT